GLRRRGKLANAVAHHASPPPAMVRAGLVASILPYPARRSVRELRPGGRTWGPGEQRRPVPPLRGGAAAARGGVGAVDRARHRQQLRLERSLDLSARALLVAAIPPLRERLSRRPRHPRARALASGDARPDRLSPGQSGRHRSGNCLEFQRERHVDLGRTTMIGTDTLGLAAADTLVNFLVLGGLGLTVILTIQSAYTLYLLFYTWDQPDAYEMARTPEPFSPPQRTFTVMLPARHEEDVIQMTIERVVRANYPLTHLEVVVICKTDDEGTIAKAAEKATQLRGEGINNVRVLTFEDGPTNKPHGLNVGMLGTRNEVVTIFDSEDDIHPDIFNVVNTVMVQDRVHVVQCGVQLMNYQSNWYSTHNVLEYFFWFKSRLHYHARTGAIPLGGNTVFFARTVLERVDG